VPPQFLALAFSLPLALLVSPDFVAGIPRQLAASLGFVANYFEILTGGTYEAQMLPHLFLHTWSLSVEMHFYIVWGVVCAAAALLAKKTGRTAKSRERILSALVFAASVALAALSFVRMRQLYAASPLSPSVGYFSTAAHAFPFMLGAAAGAAFGIRLKSGVRNLVRRRPFRIAALCVMAYAVIAAFSLALALDFSDAATWRTGFLSASLLAVAVILSARVLHESTPESVREPRPLTALADISYDVYLFHWPLYIIFSHASLPGLSGGLGVFLVPAVALAASLGLSMFTFYFIEPVWLKKRQFGAARKISTSVAVAAALAASCLVCLRAPATSVLEQELVAGYAVQDKDAIYSLKKTGDAITDAPVVPRSRRRSPVQPAESFAVSPFAPSVPSDSDMPGGVTVIGDSVCLGARSTLMSAIPECYVDASGSRQMGQGYDIMMALQKAGELREYVVIALGTNASPRLGVIDRIVEDVKPGHRLVFVTPYKSDMKETWNSYKTMAYIRSLPERYPFVAVADWAAAIDPQKELLGSDKAHIGGNEAAKALYTDCIVKALNVAWPKPGKPDGPSPAGPPVAFTGS